MLKTEASAKALKQMIKYWQYCGVYQLDNQRGNYVKCCLDLGYAKPLEKITKKYQQDFVNFEGSSILLREDYFLSKRAKSIMRSIFLYRKLY